MNTVLVIAVYLLNHTPEETRRFLKGSIIPVLTEEQYIEDKVLRIENILDWSGDDSSVVLDNLLFAFQIKSSVIEAVRQDPSVKHPVDSFSPATGTITLSSDAFERFVGNCFADPRPLSDKLKKVAADLDENGFEQGV